jgi:hypothetical protein
MRFDLLRSASAHVSHLGAGAISFSLGQPGRIWLVGGGSLLYRAAMALHRLGATPATPVTILSDGADGPRSLGEAGASAQPHHVLGLVSSRDGPTCCPGG